MLHAWVKFPLLSDYNDIVLELNVQTSLAALTKKYAMFLTREETTVNIIHFTI